MESVLAGLQAIWTAVSSATQPVWSSMAPVWGVLARVQWLALCDILIMTCLVYQVYACLRGTRALRVLGGVIVLGLGGVIARKAGLLLTAWFLSGIGAAAFIVVLILFQAEIRQILELLNPRLPRLPAHRLLRRVGKLLLPHEELRVLAEAIFVLAEKRCGALFIFERRDLLEPLLRSPGTVMNAEVSPELLETLFTPPTPLHDGAVYVRAGKIYRAGCVLPLSDDQGLASFYGTRHRAALGLTERSDAVAVVVSEERGAVAVAEHASLQTIASREALVVWLGHALSVAGETSPRPRRRWFNLHLLHLLTFNWQPKLVAFTAVALVWFVLVGRQNTEVGFSIPVVYTNVPESLTLQDQQAQQVYVSLHGSEEMLNFVDPDRMRATLNLEGAVAGKRRYTITPADINFPPGLQVSRINPSRISIRLRKKPPDTSSSGP